MHWRDIPGSAQVRMEVRVPLEAMEDMEASSRFSREMAETAHKDEFISEMRVMYS